MTGGKSAARFHCPNRPDRALAVKARVSEIARRLEQVAGVAPSGHAGRSPRFSAVTSSLPVGATLQPSIFAQPLLRILPRTTQFPDGSNESRLISVPVAICYIVP
jgi:hypothetical protein